MGVTASLINDDLTQWLVDLRTLAMRAAISNISSILATIIPSGVPNLAFKPKFSILISNMTRVRSVFQIMMKGYGIHG